MGATYFSAIDFFQEVAYGHVLHIIAWKQNSTPNKNPNPNRLRDTTVIEESLWG
jgi:hypothetical protein